MRNGRAPRREGGFTYLGLIIFVTVIGLVGAATLKVDALLRRAAAEEELLEIGAAFGEALRTYAEATPKGQPQQPPTLQELLKDPRFPGVRRHLRKIFVDPLTGKAEWGIVWANPGDKRGVLAVYSLSKAKPLKVANFDKRFSGFENKKHVSDWKFAATGQALMQGQILAQDKPPPPGQPSLFQPPAGTQQEPPSLFPGRGATQSPPAEEAPPSAPPPSEPAPDKEDKENKEDEPAAGDRQAPPVT
ncbi:Type II secretory pathway, pseudopilin PulG [Massilia sp. PDC64]|nr:type II secretion system protein [Massilia sp. PDC64]SDC85472.1 Type II secretory pathway, pseudopilin PulG [Massilia sp. PDC64]